MMSSIYSRILFRYEPSLTALMGRGIYLQGIKIPCYKIITRASGSIIRDQLFFSTTPTSQGMGLSLSNDIIKAHGGDIKVETPSDRVILVRTGTGGRACLPIGIEWKANLQSLKLFYKV